jgi:CDP-paratose 2-epimerase
MTILITGIAGFVGSSLALLLKASYPAYEIYGMDNLKRRGSELNLPRLKEKGIHFFHGDIRNKEDFFDIPAVDCIIECSAEPSVLAGIDSPPDYLIHTNFNGTINCLNFAAKHKAQFIFLSTSRIYPINRIEQIVITENEKRFDIATQQAFAGISGKGISEQFPLEGYRSLYGASKLSSEYFVSEYNQYCGIKTVINRCGVIAGPWQMGKIDQGVAVLWMAKHFWNQKLAYIGFGGQGKQVRDMLHVKDLYTLIDFEIHHADQVNGAIYNAGGGLENSVSLLELTDICSDITGNTIEIARIAETRQADIMSYITDNTKITSETGWKPEHSIHSIFEDIYSWLKANEQQLKPILA